MFSSWFGGGGESAREPSPPRGTRNVPADRDATNTVQPTRPTARTQASHSPSSRPPSEVKHNAPMAGKSARLQGVKSIDYKQFSEIRGQARAAFDDIEDWMAEAFGGNRDNLMALLDAEDLDNAVSQKRRGMRFFAAGRVRDRRMFASILFPMFQGDPHEKCYREAVEDILRVAGGSVGARTRHKLSFDLGVLYFTADGKGNMYGVVASECFPMGDAFKLLEELLDVYDNIDINPALDKADASLWSEAQIRDDAFGVRNLAVSAWKKYSRPDDGFSYDPLEMNLDE